MPTSVSDVTCVPDMSLPVACLGKGPPTASHGREAAWLHQNPAVSSTQTQSGLQSGPCIWSPRHKPHTEVLPVLFNCVALSVPILLMQLKLMPPGNCPGVFVIPSTAPRSLHVASQCAFPSWGRRGHVEGTGRRDNPDPRASEEPVASFSEFGLAPSP